jgi:pSer/pThr/pTyr-binding forkhead associated (FHA) protein
MESNQTLKDFLEKHKDIPEHFFLNKYKDPFLVISMPLGKDVFSRPTEKTGMRTLKAEPKGDRHPDPDLNVTIVTALEAAGPVEEVAFTLGRSSENDVVLFHPFVSSFHAVIQKDTDTGEYVYMDLGSTYGSALNGKPVDAKEPHPISDGSALLLGEAVFCTFMTAKSFFAFLQQMGAGS